MARSDFSSFHVRLPAGLKGRLQAATLSTGNSLNREIIARVERTFEPDDAMQIADSMRPLLDSLNDRERIELIEHIVGFFLVLSRRRKV